MKNIVVLGGGYGGLTVVNELLEKELPNDTELYLVDRMPYQGLKTEYYALAAGTASDLNIRVAFPTDPRLIIRYGEVTAVDYENKRVLFENDEPIAYDQLIIALGCVDKFHCIPGADTFANSIQSLCGTRKTYQAVNDVRPYGQISIVGGGLSGVEVAAELRESRPDLNIRIIDRGASILSPFPNKLKNYVKGWFEEHDVEMLSYIQLCRVEPNELLAEDRTILTDATVWTAGIQPSPIVQALDFPKDPQGRVVINKFHQVPDHEEIYIVGDCASLPFSPSGQLAEAQGKQVAEVIRAQWNGETPRLGIIKLKGVLGSLGKKSGFGLMGKRTMKGRVPRLLKEGVLWMSKRHFG